MSNKNRSVSNEDLENTSGGFILKGKTNDGRPAYAVFDDNRKLVAMPVASEQAAKALATQEGVQNQDIIDPEHLMKHLGGHMTADKLKAIRRSLGFKED